MSLMEKIRMKTLEKNLEKNVDGVMLMAKAAIKEILSKPEWQKRIEEWVKEDIQYHEPNKVDSTRPEDRLSSD